MPWFPRCHHQYPSPRSLLPLLLHANEICSSRRQAVGGANDLTWGRTALRNRSSKGRGGVVVVENKPRRCNNICVLYQPRLMSCMQLSQARRRPPVLQWCKWFLSGLPPSPRFFSWSNEEGPSRRFFGRRQKSKFLDSREFGKESFVSKLEEPHISTRLTQKHFRPSSWWGNEVASSDT